MKINLCLYFLALQCCKNKTNKPLLAFLPKEVYLLCTLRDSNPWPSD